MKIINKISWKFHYQRQIHVTIVRLSRFLFFFYFSFHFCTEAINLSFWINGDENVLKSTFTDFKHGGITVYDEQTTQKLGILCVFTLFFPRFPDVLCFLKKNTMHASSVLLGLMTLFCGKTCIFQCDIIQICLQRFSDYKLWTQLIYDISSFSLKFSETLANSQAQRNVCGTDEQQGLSLCYFAAQYFKRRYVS